MYYLITKKLDNFSNKLLKGDIIELKKELDESNTKFELIIKNQKKDIQELNFFQNQQNEQILQLQKL